MEEESIAVVVRGIVERVGWVRAIAEEEEVDEDDVLEVADLEEAGCAGRREDARFFCTEAMMVSSICTSMSAAS